MQNSSVRVAFLGMGLMGAPMASNLVKAGYSVAVWNRTARKCEPVVAVGAQAFATPAGAAQGADFVISCVTDSGDVEAILWGENGALQASPANALFIDMSTIAPAKAVEIGGKIRESGRRFLEAPVTGGEIGAKNGTLSILAGGEESDFQAAQGVFEAMGKTITYCGGPGNGQGVKLCNQIMGAMNLLGVCEALLLAQKMGINPSLIPQALGGGAAASWALQNLAPKIINGDFAPGFMVDTQQKDMRLVAASAESAGAPLPGAALATQLWRAAQAQGMGEDGIQAMFKVLAQMANLQK